MALIDLHFADEKTKDIYDCETCRKKTKNFVTRKCDKQGFDNHAEKAIDKFSYKYKFCVSKATWYEEIIEVFEHCIVAYETGIMPKEGGFVEQDELFVDVFPVFVQRWKQRNYSYVWSDVRQYVELVLTSIFGKKGK